MSQTFLLAKREYALGSILRSMLYITFLMYYKCALILLALVLQTDSGVAVHVSALVHICSHIFEYCPVKY